MHGLNNEPHPFVSQNAYKCLIKIAPLIPVTSCRFSRQKRRCCRRRTYASFCQSGPFLSLLVYRQSVRREKPAGSNHQSYSNVRTHHDVRYAQQVQLLLQFAWGSRPHFGRQVRTCSAQPYVTVTQSHICVIQIGGLDSVPPGEKNSRKGKNNK